MEHGRSKVGPVPTKLEQMITFKPNEKRLTTYDLEELKESIVETIKQPTAPMKKPTEAPHELRDAMIVTDKPACEMSMKNGTTDERAKNAQKAEKKKEEMSYEKENLGVTKQQISAIVKLKKGLDKQGSLPLSFKIVMQNMMYRKRG
eukprot:8484877-Ditylum_brightwellii.AAC.1